MYYQITTRCNMTCGHCCYSCVKKGQDMSLATFKTAISRDDDEMVSIGGGEPTLHPHFWEIMGLALGHYEHVWLATNGSVTDTALALARMARRGVIGAALSRDAWHDPIDQRVVDAFTRDKPKSTFLHVPNNEDYREIRTAGQYSDPIKAGRCDWGEDGCVCGDLIVKPSGIVRACGCDDAPVVGDITKDGVELPTEWVHGECWKSNEQVPIKKAS